MSGDGKVFFFALLAWAMTSVADAEVQLIIVFGAAGGSILAAIAVLLAALRAHLWVIAADGLRTEERPKVPFTGFTKRAFVPWGDVGALRRIESGLERQIEIETRSGTVHRMAQDLLPDSAGRLTVADHAGLDALEAAISERLAAAGLATPHGEEGLSFWNRLPGLAILCLTFAVSILIAGAALIGLSSGKNFYGALLKGDALVLLLPVGTGYMVFKSVKRRMRVHKRR